GRVAPAELDWRENSLRFDYAQPDFEMGAAERYQVMLEGMDNTWSAWTNETYRDYTNLPEGTYRFRVRARDAYGGLGSEANFSFRVLPPWYRSWWAYLTWCALLLLVAKGAMRWRLRTLRRRNQALTKLVEERTEALECANSALVDQTITDALTGLRNRRYVIDHVDKDIATVQRNYRNLALGYADHADANINLLFLMMDLDHFKEVNDRYGHAAGDRVLAQLRDILVAATRETDTPVRWGGEEFLIVARFANNAFGPVVADRIRTMVADHPFDLGNGLTIHRTCSVGFASYPVFAASKHNFGWEDVVNLADQCLYRAKRDGRNRWVGDVRSRRGIFSHALRATAGGRLAGSGVQSAHRRHPGCAGAPGRSPASCARTGCPGACPAATTASRGAPRSRSRPCPAQARHVAATARASSARVRQPPASRSRRSPRRPGAAAPATRTSPGTRR